MPHQEEALREGSYICRFVCWQVLKENTFLFVMLNRFSARLGKKEIMEETDVVEEKVLGIEQRMCKY